MDCICRVEETCDGTHSEARYQRQLAPVTFPHLAVLAVLEAPAAEKFVVANFDEGDPGVYIDRFLVEDDPHTLIEAMTIAAYAVGAQKGLIYVRNEYPRAEAILRAALTEARRPFPAQHA